MSHASDHSLFSANTVAHSTAMLHSKETAGFSDYPPSATYSTFMHHSQVIDYLEGYANAFQLKSHIKFQREVVNVYRQADWRESGLWAVEYRGYRDDG